MAKDRLHYRAARKFALGSLVVEKSIGITQLVSAAAVSPATESDDDRLSERRTALMKWSFDDTIVEEILPSGLILDTRADEPSSSPVSSTTADSGDGAARSVEPSGRSILLRVVSEGIPDPVLERALRERLPRHMPFHFLTPVDFAACTARYVWVRGEPSVVLPHLKQNGITVADSAESNGGDKEDSSSSSSDGQRTAHLARTPNGEVWLGPAHVVAVPAATGTFPLRSLPHLRYTVVLRDIPGGLNGILPRLESLRDRGFLNYGHIARHGLGTLRAYQDGKALLGRDYTAFLQSHAQALSEGTPRVARELPALLEALADSKATVRDWRGVLTGIELGAKLDRESVRRWEQTGLYRTHHDMLVDFATRAADVAPRSHDSAQVIREAVPRRVLQEKLRAVSEVHFNAMASLRFAQQQQQPGSSGVCAGDVVVLDENRTEGRSDGLLLGFDGVRDVYEGMADRVHADMVSAAHQDWVYLGQEELTTARVTAVASGRLRVVRSQAEAAGYRPEQVVLPTLGRGWDELPALLTASNDGGGDEMNMSTAQALAGELHIEGLPMMRTAPLASFRHLICRPQRFAAYVVDEQRGWDWSVDGSGGGGESVAAGLKRSLYKDQEGVTRVRSPLMALNGKNMIARRGIPSGGGCGGSGAPEDLARHHFLKPARKPGMLCVLRMDLPRGSPVTSALREVVQFTTLSPTAIFHLITRR